MRYVTYLEEEKKIYLHNSSQFHNNRKRK